MCAEKSNHLTVENENDARECMAYYDSLMASRDMHCC